MRTVYESLLVSVLFQWGREKVVSLDLSYQYQRTGKHSTLQELISTNAKCSLLYAELLLPPTFTSMASLPLKVTIILNFKNTTVFSEFNYFHDLYLYFEPIF